MANRPKTPKEPEAVPKLEGNASLFKEFGPRWMLACIVAERFPYKTALGIVSTLLTGLVLWIKTR